MIAARQCIRVSECVFVLCSRRCFDVCMFCMNEEFVDCHCCEAMLSCGSMYVSLCMNEAYAHSLCARRCFDMRMCLHESSVSSLSFVLGNACMCVCMCMNEAYAHFHVSEAMVSCAYMCA
jgi:hypothetical protein